MVGRFLWSWELMLRRPLLMDLDGRMEEFRSPAEFETWLRPRVDISTDDTRRFTRRSEREVMRELHTAERAYRNALELLLRSVEFSEPLGRLWQRLDISLTPEDHDWSSILFALGETRHVPERYRRVGLVKYVQYLGARRDVLGKVLRELQRAKEPEAVPSVRRVAERVPVDASRVNTRSMRGVYVRLPRRKPVSIELSEGEDIPLILARRRFKLTRRDGGLVLIDDRRRRHEIVRGRTFIGRSQICEVQVAGESPDISRKHACIDLLADGSILVTDLSTRGTFVPTRAVPEKGLDPSWPAYRPVEAPRH